MWKRGDGSSSEPVKPDEPAPTRRGLREVAGMVAGMVVITGLAVLLIATLADPRDPPSQVSQEAPDEEEGNLELTDLPAPPDERDEPTLPPFPEPGALP